MQIRKTRKRCGLFGARNAGMLRGRCRPVAVESVQAQIPEVRISVPPHRKNEKAEDRQLEEQKKGRPDILLQARRRHTYRDLYRQRKDHPLLAGKSADIKSEKLTLRTSLQSEESLPVTDMTCSRRFRDRLEVGLLVQEYRVIS